MRNMASQFSGFLWSLDITASQRALLKQFKETSDEGALTKYATRLREGRKCHLLSKKTMGGNHSIRIIEFDDNVQWLARIQLERSDHKSVLRLRSEIDTMRYLRQRTKVPVPQIYGAELEDSNPVGRAFVLMECIPGNAVMDLDGGYEAHGGQVADLRKPRLYKEFAAIHVELTSLRMSKIGTIIRKSDGSYDVGPVPGLGGPFATGMDFFNQWIKVHSTFPQSDSVIHKMCGSLADEVLSSIHAFPTKLQGWANNPKSTAPGPFPLHHPDTYLSNVLVDDDNHVVGLIDWEGAYTTPWELVGVPIFLDTVPAPIDAPRNYDAKGRPTDPEIQKKYKERKEYISFVEAAEKRSSTADDSLSRCLRSSFHRHLSYVIREWSEGKVGFHDRIFR